MTDPGTILKLDQDRREAMVRADVPALTAMFADGLMWIHANGRVDTKDRSSTGSQPPPPRPPDLRER